MHIPKIYPIKLDINGEKPKMVDITIIKYPINVFIKPTEYSHFHCSGLPMYSFVPLAAVYFFSKTCISAFEKPKTRGRSSLLKLL